jgi:hypothetical protein
MRKIETLMNDAISNKVDFKSANTEVIYYSGNDISDVYLHGNLIARVYAHSIELMDGGYQSNTTKSRLNAILKVHGTAYTKERNLSTPRVTKSPQIPHKSPSTPNKYPQGA